MKILAVSDKVEESFFAPGQKMPELEGIELIIACGDLPSSYLEYLVTILNVPLFYVLGNHDPQLYGQHINGCTCLDESTVLFKGKIIGGLSGSIKYSDAKLMYTEMQMHGKIARLFPYLIYNRLRYKRYLDILITHSPILGVHDEPTRVHKGFEALKMFVRQYRPKFHFHGHTMVRNNRFKTKVYGTRIINVNHWQILDV